MFKRLVIVVALSAVLPGAAGGATPPATTRAAAAADSLDALLAPIVEKRKLPGLVAALVEGDDVIAIGAAGVRKLGSPEPITVDDKLHLGSCTKAMTATVIARLIERKQLRWDLTVGETFADLTPRVHEGYRGATLEQMLQHRAGLPENTEWVLFGWDKRKGATEQRAEVAAYVLAHPPASAPGTAHAYSNVGYSIVASMAERAAGRPFEQLMREELFDPLGMRSAGFGPPGTLWEVDQPWGHLVLGKLAVPTQGDNLPPLNPAGRVHCSMRDWATFVSLHLRGARGEPTTLLTAETFARLHRLPPGEDYAMGWIVLERPWAGGTILTHAGSNNMWFCMVWIAPKKDFAVLAATNMGGEAGAAGCNDACAAMIVRHQQNRQPPRVAATLPATRLGR